MGSNHGKFLFNTKNTLFIFCSPVMFKRSVCNLNLGCWCDEQKVSGVISIAESFSNLPPPAQKKLTSVTRLSSNSGSPLNSGPAAVDGDDHWLEEVVFLCGV